MLVPVILLFYDIVTTLDIEITRVWSGRFSPFTILWALVSWIYIGIHAGLLTERNRNRTAGSQYLATSSWFGWPLAPVLAPL